MKTALNKDNNLIIYYARIVFFSILAQNQKKWNKKKL